MSAGDQLFAYVLACGDPKIRSRILWELDQRLGPENHFWLPELGGAKDLIMPEKDRDRERLLRKMETAAKVHRFGLIILINHSDCGAYRLSGHTFTDPQEEERFHVEQLKKAAEVVREKFPRVAVERHYFLKAEQRMAW
ncbi:MAG: hypothetical protein HYW91_01390 [Candidatus Sungbacteria bacterium]|nr:hypothetical protein [Candidatus Sungbacteria bacterium]